MKKTTDRDIVNLQDNLYALRRLAGWTAEDLGDLIGVTKQTIRNLEKRHNGATMSKTQYIAIRTMLDYEIADNPDNVALEQAVRILLDSEEMPEEQYEKAKNAVTVASGAAATGMDYKATETVLNALIETIPVIVAGASWIARAVKGVK